MVRECLVKECSVFRDRSQWPMEPEPMKSSVICLKGNDWKRVRGVLNGSFTAAKIKLMMPTMSRCARVTLELLDEVADTGKPADITSIAKGCSIDVIAKCALAWQVDCQRNPQNELLQHLEKITDGIQDSVVVLAVLFLGLGSFLEWCFKRSSYGKIFNRVIDDLHEVIRLRREGKRPVVPDLLQLMLDAQKVSSKGGENDSQPAITDKQLVANAFFSMAAGYETTATMMGFILYELARHPEEQDRIYDEMTALLNSQTRCGSESCDSNGHSELNYEQLQSLRRLDAVLCECLRMYPPIVSFIDRNCNRDITIKGCHIPAGMGIMVHVWHVHHDPDFWPDPYRFDPDRFYVQPTSDVKDPSGTFSSTSRHQHHPGSYLPFGLGPRECLGRRFAILELKMMVTKIVQRYRLALPEEEGNKGGIKIKARALLIHPATDIKLLVRKRNAN